MKIKILIDKLLTFICFFIPAYLLSHFITDSVLIKSIIAILTSILALVVISFIQYKRKSKVNYKNFELYVSVQGASYIYDKLLSAFSNLSFERKSDYLINKEKTMIYCSVKFGNVSPDEILKINKIAKEEGSKKCYLIAKELPKNSAITAFNFADNIKFIPLKIVFKLLKSKNLINDKLDIKLGKLNYSKNIFDIIFDISNIKKFLFVAIVLFAFSFIIPFKTYYIVLGVINIVFAIICLVRGRSLRFSGKYEIFEQKGKENNTLPE